MITGSSMIAAQAGSNARAVRTQTRQANRCSLASINSQAAAHLHHTISSSILRKGALALTWSGVHTAMPGSFYMVR